MMFLAYLIWNTGFEPVISRTQNLWSPLASHTCGNAWPVFPYQCKSMVDEIFRLKIIFLILYSKILWVLVYVILKRKYSFRWDSNPRSMGCEANDLPLSYLTCWWMGIKIAYIKYKRRCLQIDQVYAICHFMTIAYAWINCKQLNVYLIYASFMPIHQLVS